MASISIDQVKQGSLGICGFATMIQFLVDHGKMKLDNYTSKTVINLVKTFANHWVKTQILHDKKIKDPAVITALKHSLIFTKTFSGYEQTTLNKALNVDGTWNWNKVDGLALTPEAICDYLNRKFGFKMMIKAYHPNKKFNALNSFNETGIYGIGKGGVNGTLAHWVYVDKQNRLMTWGSKEIKAFNAMKLKGYNEILIRLYTK